MVARVFMEVAREYDQILGSLPLITRTHARTPSYCMTVSWSCFNKETNIPRQHLSILHFAIWQVHVSPAPDSYQPLTHTLLGNWCDELE